MSHSFTFSRRSFLKYGSLALTGLILGAEIHANQVESQRDYEVIPYLVLSNEGKIKVIVHRSEMGQGVRTSLPMILLEQLNTPLHMVEVLQADAELKYGLMFTGGSMSVKTQWKTLEKAGAVFRELFILAASLKEGVSKDKLEFKNAAVYHLERRIELTTLVHTAQNLDLPNDAKPYEGEPRLLTKPLKRTDTLAKITGKAQFGIDVNLPGLKIAVMKKPPLFGAKLKGFEKINPDHYEELDEVLTIEDDIVLVGSSFPALNRIKESIKASYSGDSGLNSDLIRAQLEVKLKESLQNSTIENGFSRRYFLPYQAHCTMEVQNCTAWYKGRSLEIYAPCQVPLYAKKTVQQFTGLSSKAVRFHVTFLGGGFGRRLERDYVLDAVKISKRVRKPIKLIFSREDDLSHDFYRPCSLHEMRAEFNGKKIERIEHHFVTPSILEYKVGKGVLLATGYDPSSLEGTYLPYEINSQEVFASHIQNAVPLGWWRSVYDSQNAFAKESFMDELSYELNLDPVDFRLNYLLKSSRDYNVMRALHAMPEFQAMRKNGCGIAVHHSFGTYLAMAMNTKSLEPIQAKQVIAVVDCGKYVNPDIIQAQVEGSIAFGLSAALKSAVHFKNGGVKEWNFNDHPLLLMHEMPEVLVKILESTESPGGMGEPGVPPVAPALFNAVYKKSGKRVRELPTEFLKV